MTSLAQGSKRDPGHANMDMQGCSGTDNKVVLASAGHDSAHEACAGVRWSRLVLLHFNTPGEKARNTCGPTARRQRAVQWKVLPVQWTDQGGSPEGTLPPPGQAGR